MITKEDNWRILLFFCVYSAQDYLPSFQQRNVDIYIVRLKPGDEVTDSTEHQT